MSLTALEKWERQLRQALDQVDARLEDKYGGSFKLHPNRPQQGQTANVKYDGLFSVEAKFSMGFVHHRAPGYVIEMRTATAEPVTEKVKRQMLDDVGDFLTQALEEFFPGREMHLERDGSHFYLSGDLQLEK